MRVREHKQLGSGQEMAEKYRINWDRHGTNISEAFRSLRKDEHLSDVTLACEEHQFQAHKVVLSAGSSFFERILETHKHPSPLIFLKGMEAKILDRLLDFMYHGNVELKEEELEIFLKSGEELGLRGLAASGSKPAGVPSEELSPSQNEMKLSSELAKESHGPEAPPHSSVSSSSTSPLEENQNMMCGHGLGWLSRWPSHFTKEWLNGFSASWESSICERKLHYPGNRTQDLLLTGEIWQPL